MEEIVFEGYGEGVLAKRVESVEELVCKKHPEAEFVSMGKIRIYLSQFGKEGKHEKYGCKGCIDEDREGIFITKGYDCPDCGIVQGDYTEVPYDNSKPLSGIISRGDRYCCTICGYELGQFESEVS